MLVLNNNTNNTHTKQINNKNTVVENAVYNPLKIAVQLQILLEFCHQ